MRKKRSVFRGADPKNKFIAGEFEQAEVFPVDGGYYNLNVSWLDFEKIDKRRALFNRPVIQKFLDSYNLNIDVDDFINLLNLQSYIYMMWPDCGKNLQDRKDILRRHGKDNPMYLGDAFRAKIATDVECSLFAQLYLEHCGMKDPEICFGNAFFKQNPKIEEETSKAHAYLVIKLKDRNSNGLDDKYNNYIYDPANPMLEESKRIPIVPRIMDFSKIRFRGLRAFQDLLYTSVEEGGGFAYVEASDIYGCGNHWLYGFETDDVENRVSHRKTVDGIKRQITDQEFMQQIYVQGGRNY